MRPAGFLKHILRFWKSKSMGEKASKTAIFLFNKLKAFYNDKDFILGIMSNAPHEEDMKNLMDYMDNGQDVTIDNLILLSLELGNNREKKN